MLFRSDIAVIATSEETNNRALYIYRNDTSLNGGNLLFAIDMSLDEGLSPILVAKGDIDGDGGDDLISINAVSSFRSAGNQLRMRNHYEICKAADFDCVEDINNTKTKNHAFAWF